VGSSAGYLAGQAIGDALNGAMGGKALMLATTSAVGSWASSQVMGYNSSTTLARMSQAFASGLGYGIGEALMEGNVATSGSYRNGSDMASDSFNPASAYLYRNGADVANGPEAGGATAWNQAVAATATAASLDADDDFSEPIPPMVDLGGGKYRRPDGRIVEGGITTTDPVPAPLYLNGEGKPVYSGDGGRPFFGLALNTNFVAPHGGPRQFRENGGALSYTFDSAGQPFWRTASGRVMSIPAPYAMPKLASLQRDALWGGVADGIGGLPSLPGQFISGLGALFTGQVGVNDLLASAIENSPVGMLLSAADNDYRAVGQRMVGTGVGLATGAAFDRFALPLAARGVNNVRGYLHALGDAVDVTGNPFLAEQSLSIGSPVRGAYSPLVLAEAEFNTLHFDVDKQRFTTGAIEEIRAVQAAQMDGLAPAGRIIRGMEGADMAVEIAGADAVGYSIKAYRDAGVLSDPRRFGKLQGSLIADENMRLLLDPRNVSVLELNSITERLIGAGISADRIIVPSSSSFRPIRVQTPDGKIIYK
jgi:hypothetical protein